MFHLENKDDIDAIIMKPFSKIIKTKNKHERQEQALERELDWKWVDRIEKLRYQLSDGLVTNEVNFGGRNIHVNKLSAEKRIFKDDKYRLISSILAKSGLAFVELGK